MAREHDPGTQPIERRGQTLGWPLSRLPSTERIVDVIQDIADRVPLPRVPLPRVPVTDVLDPWGMRDRLRHGVDWVADQLGPLRDSLRPVATPLADRLDGLRDRSMVPVDESADDDGWGPIAWGSFLLVLAWLADQELTLSFDVDQALWSFDHDEHEDEDGRFELWNKTVFVPGPPLAARLGDPMMHGDPVAPGVGSSNVFIGGRPALRSCDGHVCTKATPIPHVATGFRSTYGGVEVNGFAALRVGDFVDEGPHGLDPIVAGCPTVTIGPAAPPVECWAPSGTEADRRPEGIPFRWRKGELGHFEGTVVLGVDFEGPLVRVEGTVTAARLWAEHSSTVDIPLGDIDGDGRAEAKRVTVTTTTERVLGVSDVELDVHPLARRVDAARVTPRPRAELEPVTPRVETTERIVETT